MNTLCYDANINATDYLKGALKIDEYVTHNRTLVDINDGFHDMHVSQLHPEGNRGTEFAVRVVIAFAALLTWPR